MKSGEVEMSLGRSSGGSAAGQIKLRLRAFGMEFDVQIVARHVESPPFHELGERSSWTNAAKHTFTCVKLQPILLFNLCF